MSLRPRDFSAQTRGIEEAVGEQLGAIATAKDRAKILTRSAPPIF
jgi:hypothetical protein